jgi:hypothetical protein
MYEVSIVQWLWHSPPTQSCPHLHFLNAIIPGNIPKKYFSNKLFRNFSSYITSGHLHSEVYLGKSADFYDSVNAGRFSHMNALTKLPTTSGSNLAPLSSYRLRQET